MTGAHEAPAVSVMVMAYNETDSLESVVQEIASTLKGADLAHEIVIVDDGSTDGTGVEAERLSAAVPQVRVIHHRPNQGLGAVYRTGFREARGDFLTFFPADGQFPASIITQFVPLLARADMVLGYLPRRNGSMLAKGLSRVERLLYRLLFGPLPAFQGILMFRRAILGEIELRSSGRSWVVLMELIIRASRAGYRLHSVPTAVRPRMSGASKVNNVRTIWTSVRELTRLRRRL
ncbi:MAG: glycosyltransferase family 2 protein [Gemmatimonadaceae bacterium]